MPDSSLSQAIKEAMASAPADPIYQTLELRHPAFTSPIRVVRDNAQLTAKLEAGAPLNASTYVDFLAFSFSITKPEISPTGVPQITIEIDNVDRSIVANIEAAMATTDLVQVTYREYLSSDLTAPQNNPPMSANIMQITADTFKVKAVAGFPDLINRRFPTTEYDAQTFPGLLT